jgi:L-aminopeptidase/D-esterase-like protein
VTFDKATIASGDIRGGGPGTRDTNLLDPTTTVEQVEALVLSGGSAFGLDAASGVQAWMREHDRGFAVGPVRVPIVPGAILFDLLNGGDKDWGRYPPYRELAYDAASCAGPDFELGNAGAGMGATVANLKGGLGSASAQTPGGITVGAIAAVNAVGVVTVGNTPHFWAAPFEQNNEFGGRGFPSSPPAGSLALQTKGAARVSTTLVIVATDATLTQGQTKRLAVMAQDGFARAIYPVHTPLDGDTVFAAATGARALADPVFGLMEIGALAANVVARAIARGVYEAQALPFADALPCWRDKFGC